MNLIRSILYNRNPITDLFVDVKINLLGVSAVAIALPAIAMTANGVTFNIQKEDGSSQYYRLEIPANLPPAKPINGSGWNQPQYATDKFSQSAVILAAVGWAGGLEDHDSPGAPNTLTNLGGSKPGGFYNATYIKVDKVQYFTTPVPYYFVQMNGKIAQNRQTFFADVLEDGRIVRPVAVPPPVLHSGRRLSSRSQWGGAEKKQSWGGAEKKQSGGGAEKKQSWGGAEKKQSWGGAEKKQSWGGAEKKQSWGGAEKKQSWGGAEKKQSWGGAEKKQSWGGAEKKEKWGGSEVKQKWGGSEEKEKSSN